MPDLAVTGSYTRLEFAPHTDTGTLIGRKDNYDVNLGLTQPLYLGGKVGTAIKIARFVENSAGDDIRARRQDIIVQTKVAFSQALYIEELIRVRKESLRVLQQHLNLTRDQLQAGTVSRFEVLRAEVEFSNAQPPLIQARNQWEEIKNLLKRLLAIDLATPVEIKGTLAYTESQPVDIGEAERLALIQRPEIQKQEISTQIRTQQIELAKSGYLPNLSLFANYSGLSPALSSARDNWNWRWNTGLALQIPIFNGFETSSQVSQARIQSDQDRIRLQDLKEQVKFEVRQSYMEVHEAQKRIRSQEKNLEQAQEG